jgi:hypothetical protein
MRARSVLPALLAMAIVPHARAEMVRSKAANPGRPGGPARPPWPDDSYPLLNPTLKMRGICWKARTDGPLG